MLKNQPSSAGPNSRNTGSQRALREQNVLKVIDALTSFGAQTQVSLARKTGLSQGTISNIVKRLVVENRVKTTSAISSGRKSVEVSLIADSRVVIGIDFGRTHVRMLASDTSHHTFGLRFRSLPLEHEPEHALGIANEELTKLLEAEGIERTQVVMCGVAIPASVNPVTGRVVQATALPRWSGIDLTPLASQILGIPCVLENDASLGALAQTISGPHAQTENLIYVKIASGIGIGIMLGGRVYKSANGLNGEIGHFQVVEGGAVCYCGRRGCLETVSSVRRIVADLAEIRRDSTTSLKDVIAAGVAGDPPVLRILEEAGASLGAVLALVCNLLGPDAIILGGPLTPVGEVIIQAALRSMHQRALSAAISATVFGLSQYGDEDEVHGACALALQQLTQS